MKDNPIRILLVEDDPSFVHLLKLALDAERFRYELITGLGLYSKATILYG
jgi:hypothetical protein